MARPERPLDPADGSLETFAHELRQLRLQCGNPPYHTLAEQAHYSVATLAEAARGVRKPSLEVTIAYVEACGADAAPWVRRWHELTDALEPAPGPPPTSPPPPSADRPAGDVRSPRRRADQDTALTPSERRELDELRVEVAELRRTNEVLKAASAIFARDLVRIRSGNERR
ncbi:helix-turn-helix domain-containing protein [Streptomyces sp. NPDC018045]|uniref:helix-turn-helix domain-containing protein n=1 Tax=Streptomyces sp. NPDC018045 TaxID=3365037 RepID=UPI0037A35CA9